MAEESELVRAFKASPGYLKALKEGAEAIAAACDKTPSVSASHWGLFAPSGPTSASRANKSRGVYAFLSQRDPEMAAAYKFLTNHG